MLYIPFYDPEKTYEENFEKGPFGIFANGERLQIDSDKSSDQPRYDFLGFKVNLPFGIEAGPLINGKFINDFRTIYHRFFGRKQLPANR